MVLPLARVPAFAAYAMRAKVSFISFNLAVIKWRPAFTLFGDALTDFAKEAKSSIYTTLIIFCYIGNSECSARDAPVTCSKNK